MKPRLSIVIRAFNEDAHIGRLLEGIKRQTLSDHEVIVVDSGSTDDTVAIARAHGARIVTIQPHEFSFGRALNRGCAASHGDILVFASAHVYPTHADWLERLAAPFADPSVALVYGGQRGTSHSRFSEQQIFKAWFPASAEADHGHPFCNNANCAVRASVWRDLPYDENLTGLEDLDWAKKAVGRGFKNVYDPLACIIHVHDETPSQVFNRYRREAIALKRIYPETRMSTLSFLSLLTFNIASDLAESARQNVLGSVWREIFWFRWSQFTGAYRGYREQRADIALLRRRFYYPDRRERQHLALDPADRPEPVLDYRDTISSRAQRDAAAPRMRDAQGSAR